MLLELTSAAFFFIVGVVLAAISFEFKPPYNAPFLITGGLIWIVLGAFTLTGNVIEANAYTFSSVVYNNSVISGINTTITFTPLVSSSDPMSIATAGLFGFALLGIGLFTLLIAVFQIMDWYNLERRS